MRIHISIIYFIIISLTSFCSQPQRANSRDEQMVMGAERTELYFSKLKNKRIAIVANQTSMVSGVHLVDTLLTSGFNIVQVFGPEHGFRGNQGAGIEIRDEKDVKTGLPVISLYGGHKKPTENDLQNIDLVIFDIQDVGARFYTYISTMTYVMEACAENGVAMIILDRPNPNGYYVDGPVLKIENSSFVGLHPVPVVHGMTMGEYAMMVNGEGWLKGGIKCDLEVVRVKNYDHNKKFVLAVPPSPNLPNQKAIELYPSLCFFEGTEVSVGRGTEFPFQCFGNPDYGSSFNFSFVPVSIPNKALHPKYENEKCYGVDLRSIPMQYPKAIDLSYLILAYGSCHDKSNFFNAFFDKLSGNKELKEQIESGWSETDIRSSWQEELTAYKQMRKKFLLYDDFETEDH